MRQCNILGLDQTQIAASVSAPFGLDPTLGFSLLSFYQRGENRNGNQYLSSCFLFSHNPRSLNVETQEFTDRFVNVIWLNKHCIYWADFCAYKFCISVKNNGEGWGNSYIHYLLRLKKKKFVEEWFEHLRWVVQEVSWNTVTVCQDAC